MGCCGGPAEHGGVTVKNAACDYGDERERWRMNNKGKGSGLAFVIILVAALIIGLLVVKNMSGLGTGKETAAQQENYVQQAQGLVDQINQAQQQIGQEP